MIGHITEASLAIRFDKPVTEDQLTGLVPGGYCVKTRLGKEFGFDFTWTSRSLDTHDPHVVWFKAWELDTASFPEADDLVPKIRTVEEFPECYCYVEESLGLEPAALTHFKLVIDGKGHPKTPSKTPYLYFDLYETGKDSYRCEVTFKAKLLRSCKSFPQG